jgi:quercetin dioxygenase-like cupin family protein
MKIINLKAVESATVTMAGAKDVTRQVPIGVADGAPTCSIRVFTVESGGHTMHHSHPFEHVNYVLEGTGELMSDAGPRNISKGDFILVLPNEVHQYRNAGDAPFVFICMVPVEYE